MSNFPHTGHRPESQDALPSASLCAVSNHGARNPSRRAVVLGAAAIAATPSATWPETPVSFAMQAIAFDAFVIFDPRSIAALARSLFAERGQALADTWTARLFGYTWLATAAGRYESFEALADKALLRSADGLGMTIAPRQRAQLNATYSELAVWPDVRSALDRLKKHGVRLVMLSNLGEAALRANLERSEIAHHFENVLSTDRVRRFKPSPAAYAMAMEAMGLPKRAIGFAAFAGWDAAGASWFGYRTAWINRLAAPAETLGNMPAIVSENLEGALALSRAN